MQQLGTLLRAMRQQRGLSQDKLAGRAQVTARTLRYWEANQQQPRDVELDCVLKALEATPQEKAQVYARLADQRSVRRARNEQATPSVPTALLGPLPGIGDLLRALRVRSGRTQEQFAEEMRVSRATIIRWEATRTLPSEEDMERLCLLLNASPEERAALRAKRLSPSTWPSQLTLEECLAQAQALLHIRRGGSSLMALADLHTLALKRQLRFQLNQSSEALRMLAKMEVQHGWWLYMQDRAPEACAGNWRALNLVRGKFAPEMFWVNALNLLAAHAVSGERSGENGVRLLYPWLRLLPASMHIFLLCDMALYAGRAQRAEEAMDFLRRAQHALQGRATQSNDIAAGGKEDGYAHWYYRTTKARVLLSGGKAVEALDWLPAMDRAGDERIGSLTVWADAYLAAGEKNMAARALAEAQTLLVAMPLPHRQSRVERLVQRL